MRIKKLLFVPLVFTMLGCGEKEDSEPVVKLDDVKIMCPTGAPAVALSAFSDYENFETTADPSLLMGYFAAGKYDAIVAPTDVGVKAINQGSSYKLAATITFGNFYLVSTGLDDNTTIDEGDSIVLFQQNALPDKVFHYVYGTTLDSTITYVKNVAVAATAFESKEVTTEEGDKIPVDYVLLAEPKLTALNVTTQIVNLSEEFKTKATTSKVYQASVFVKNDYKVANEFLTKVDTSIKEMIANPDKIVSNMSKVEDPATFLGMPGAMAKKITAANNGLALGYEPASENKEAIKQYLQILGMSNVDESVFY